MSIKVESLTKKYGEQIAVNHISFELAKGEIVGFLGPNGAGKSTTMKMITGYLPATEGSIRVCGYDVESQSMEVRRKVGYLPEANPLYYDMYVREYLELSAGIHKMKNVKSKIGDIISMTGLTKEVHKKIGMLSKGYKQRVGLAQAMLHEPEVLILDEPTSGLDPNQIVEIRDLIKQIGREKTVLLSTHIMQEVQAMCSRAIIINNGNIVADDKIDSLQQAPQTQQALLISFENEVSEALFKKLNHVIKTESLNNNFWKLITDKPDELRKEVMKWALENDLNIASLQSDKQSLEEVFRTLTKNN